MDKLFAKFANVTAKATGSPPAFLICVALVLAWAMSGPLFRFSEAWQLVINTGTTIVTFLMVFLIQNTQNRDTDELHIKIDELLRVTKDAQNAVLSLDNLDQKELRELRKKYKAMGDQEEADHTQPFPACDADLDKDPGQAVNH